MITGVERIELPLRVLETPVIPLDQSPMSSTDLYIYTTLLHTCQLFFVFFIFSEKIGQIAEANGNGMDAICGARISAEHKLQQKYDNAGS